MESWTEWISQQLTDGEEIQRIIRNFKKDAADRKTSEKYFTDRIQALQKLWERFEETDNKIRIAKDPPLDNEYFTKDYYNNIMALVESYTAAFQEEITKLQSDRPRRQIAQPKDQPDAQRSQDIENSAQTMQVAERLMRKLTVRMASLERLMAALPANLELQPRQFHHFKKQTIQQTWRHIEVLNDEMWSQLENPAVVGYNNNNYIKLEQQVQQVLVNLSIYADQDVSSAPEASAQPSDNSAQNKIQLPKITIPKFDGNYLNWRSFYELFSQLVDVQNIPSIQKMYYLKANVAGDAERLIRHLAPTEENYSTAWKMIQERYNNKRILVSTLIQKLVEQPSLTGSFSDVKSLKDTTQECLLALNNLQIDTSTWDPLLLHLLTKKLDRQTLIRYEQSILDPREIQGMDKFLAFLERHFHSLEVIGRKPCPTSHKTAHVHTTTAVQQTNQYKCKLCKGAQHPLYLCSRFLQLQASERLDFVRKERLCINCLKAGHMATKCPARNCVKCNQRHNTLLHLGNDKPKVLIKEDDSTDARITVAAANMVNSKQKLVILATAMVIINAPNGKSHKFKAILDSGSQVNLVSERLVKRLGLSTTTATGIRIEGIGGRGRCSDQRVNLKLHSLIGRFSTNVEAHIIPHIVSQQPAHPISTANWSLPMNLTLADPEFYQPSKIDILLGAEFYYDLLRPEQIKLGNNLPTLQNTLLGWVISGKMEESGSRSSVTCGIFSKDEQTTDELVERFWMLENFDDQKKALTASEKLCETFFTQTVSRTKEGRFVVRLPLIEEGNALGETRELAMKRFYALERRLNKDKSLKARYSNFLNEYINLGHMERISAADIPMPNYFLPHHAVLKPDSTTTKLRVVFDASAKSSNGLSLNDILHTGPTVQEELFSILVRFRSHRYTFSADVEKMYRQILVHEDDQRYQLIIWRDDVAKEIQYYRLKTVTYGTASAPYLATKCLQMLAELNKATHPIGAQAIKEDFYVDDCLSGASSLLAAKEIQDQITKILSSAGLKLRKWCANHHQLLQNIPQEDQEVDLDLNNDSIPRVKTLGVIWRPTTDQLSIRVQMPITTKVTKRSVISDLSRIFDPLGILAPVVVLAKIFIQQLWQMKIDWDDNLPEPLQHEWRKFQSMSTNLNNVKFDRYIFGITTPTSVQIHTFVDASEKAYGAAVYLRSTYQNKQTIVKLLCAKSRVAPIKNQTIPRLELCAALLGAELTHRVTTDLRLQNSKIVFWSDSEITLHWINAKAATFHTFVANRVAKIQQISTAEQWRHVKSADNPADLLSRGLSPEIFPNCTKWFYGPLFLHGRESIWPAPFSKDSVFDSALERKIKVTSTISAEITSDIEQQVYGINHRNSFRRLQRIIAYMLRFARNCRVSHQIRKIGAALSVQELEESLAIILRAIQASDFGHEIKLLTKQKQLNKDNALVSLSPFMDPRGLIRVGGRLHASTLSFDTKHPVLLPYNDPLVRLLLKELHDDNKHCGPQALLAVSRQRFWIVKGKSMARSIVQKCVRCTRARPQLFKQIMGSLPADRITSTRPFLVTGVDYCGPLWVHYKIRGKKPHKIYLAIFCCFSTKAVHLELVSDLTTEAFIGAIKRFISRRGRCQTIYCDNATNFVGARNLLKELHESLFSHDAQQKIVSACSANAIEFKFIPPRAPHFGGLWEAAVKSAKHLLVRTVSTASLTYEELETVIIEIEAILNSRPITPISADPNDLTALTPAHFLIGEPLTAQVDRSSAVFKGSLIKRWNLVSELKHAFWDRWRNEYLTSLQQRPKWREQLPDPKEGTLVILKEDNAPPLQWPLGRITQLFRGNDGVVRVVNVKTASGSCRRPIHRLCPLLHDEDSEEAESSTVRRGRKNRRPVDDAETPARKRIDGAPVSFALTCLVALVMLPALFANPINVTNFGNQPGIYFEGIGSMKTASTEWKIVAYVDLASINDEMEGLRNGTTMLRRICTNIQIKRSCEALVNHFAAIIAELQFDKGIIASSRQKRGAFNVVGNIARSLFGVLDNEYAETISATINTVHNNDKLLLDLIRNQTSIVDSTLNVMKRGNRETQNQLKRLQEQLTETRNEIGHYEQFQRYISLSTQLSIIATNLRQVHADIIDILTMAHHGRISPLLLTPNQLQDQIIEIRTHLPRGLSLPIEPDNHLQLYKIMTTQGTLTEDHVVFVTTIPLVGSEYYQLFNLIPIPAVTNNTIQKIVPSADILAINLHRDRYSSMSWSEVKRCILLSAEHYICTGKQITYGSDSEILQCEVDLLTNKQTSSCAVSLSTNKLEWYPTNNKNEWIFAVTTELQMSAVCDQESMPVRIKGSGMLQLEDNCSIRNNALNIEGHHSITSSMQLSYVRVQTIQDPTAETKGATTDSPHQEFTTLAERELEEFKGNLKNIRLPDPLQPNTIHHHIVSYSALCLGLAVSIWIIHQCLRKRSKSRATNSTTSHSEAPPKPPRTRADSTFSIHI